MSDCSCGGMTDRQFKAYNRLICLVDELIEKLPDEEKKKYQEKKEDALRGR